MPITIAVTNKSGRMIEMISFQRIEKVILMALPL
jgi:hypothetical protein